MTEAHEQSHEEGGDVDDHLQDGEALTVVDHVDVLRYSNIQICV